MRGSSSRLPSGRRNRYKLRLEPLCMWEEADMQERNTAVFSASALFVRFVGIHGNLGLLMLHEHVGTLYFTDHFRVVMVAQARNSLT
jgi:hypothetical protein